MLGMSVVILLIAYITDLLLLSMMQELYLPLKTVLISYIIN